MTSILGEFRAHILDLLEKIENDIRRTKDDWENRRGVFHDGGYVYRENLTVFESELTSVGKVKELVASMDLTGYETVEDFKAHVTSELEDLYDQSILLRSGISIIIESIKRLKS